MLLDVCSYSLLWHRELGSNFFPKGFIDGLFLTLFCCIKNSDVSHELKLLNLFIFKTDSNSSLATLKNYKHRFVKLIFKA